MKPGKHGERGVIVHEDNAIAKGGCVVVDEVGRILLITNANRAVWALPKGHAEHGETLEEVAVRETEEETGYKVELGRRLDDLEYTHGKTGRAIRVAFWLARVTDGSPDLGEAHVEWTELDRALKLVYSNVAEYLSQQDLSRGGA